MEKLADVQIQYSPEPRQAINSQAYVDKGITNVFDDLPPAPTLVEETFEDGVVIEIDNEKYEIIPYSRTRMKVKRHYEESSDHGDINLGTDGTALTPISVGGNTGTRESLRTGEGDREVMHKTKGLLAYERVTHDPELWEVLRRLRAPQQEIVIPLPRGYTFDRKDQRKLKKLVDHLAHNQLKPALSLISEISAQVDKDKVVDEHPGLLSHLKNRLHLSV